MSKWASTEYLSLLKNIYVVIFLLFTWENWHNSGFVAENYNKSNIISDSYERYDRCAWYYTNTKNMSNVLISFMIIYMYLHKKYLP